MKCYLVALALAMAAFANPAHAGQKVIYGGVPDGWHIGRVNQQADAESCKPPRRLELTRRCVEIPNPKNPARPGKRCDWECIR